MILQVQVLLSELNWLSICVKESLQMRPMLLDWNLRAKNEITSSTADSNNDMTNRNRRLLQVMKNMHWTMKHQRRKSTSSINNYPVTIHLPINHQSFITDPWPHSPVHHQPFIINPLTTNPATINPSSQSTAQWLGFRIVELGKARHGTELYGLLGFGLPAKQSLLTNSQTLGYTWYPWRTCAPFQSFLKRGSTPLRCAAVRCSKRLTWKFHHKLRKRFKDAMKDSHFLLFSITIYWWFPVIIPFKSPRDLP